MDEHIHKYNATVISTKQNQAVRCSCGSWSSPKRIKAGEQSYNERYTKSLETRLKNATKWETEVETIPCSGCTCINCICKARAISMNDSEFDTIEQGDY